MAVACSNASVRGHHVSAAASAVGGDVVVRAVAADEERARARDAVEAVVGAGVGDVESVGVMSCHVHHLAGSADAIAGVGSTVDVMGVAGGAHAALVRGELMPPRSGQIEYVAFVCRARRLRSRGRRVCVCVRWLAWRARSCASASLAGSCTSTSAAVRGVRRLGPEELAVHGDGLVRCLDGVVRRLVRDVQARRSSMTRRRPRRRALGRVAKEPCRVRRQRRTVRWLSPSRRSANDAPAQCCRSPPVVRFAMCHTSSRSCTGVSRWSEVLLGPCVPDKSSRSRAASARAPTKNGRGPTTRTRSSAPEGRGEQAATRALGRRRWTARARARELARARAPRTLPTMCVEKRVLVPAASLSGSIEIESLTAAQSDVAPIEPCDEPRATGASARQQRARAGVQSGAMLTRTRRRARARRASACASIGRLSPRRRCRPTSLWPMSSASTRMMCGGGRAVVVCRAPSASTAPPPRRKSRARAARAPRALRTAARRLLRARDARGGDRAMSRSPFRKCALDFLVTPGKMGRTARGAPPVVGVRVRVGCELATG